LQRALRAHRGESGHARAACKPHGERFGLIIGVMGGDDGRIVRSETPRMRIEQAVTRVSGCLGKTGDRLFIRPVKNGVRQSQALRLLRDIGGFRRRFRAQSMINRRH
jgi:hypothetical protein